MVFRKEAYTVPFDLGVPMAKEFIHILCFNWKKRNNMLKGELRSVISPANDVGELKSCCIRTEHKETCETKYINGFETSNTGSEQE